VQLLAPGRAPMVWTADGATLRFPFGDLGVFLTYCAAEHINNHGDVVGRDEAPVASGTNPDLQPIGWVAFDVLSGSPVVKIDLLTLVDTTAVTNWKMLHPFEINDRGEICGRGVWNAFIGDGSGGARGFLMIPNTPDRFRNLSRSLSGVDGHPVMIAKGTLEAGSSLDVALYKAAPSALAFLAAGFGTLYVPLQGGVLVPDVFSAGGRLLPVVTDAMGNHDISTTWPVGVPAGFELVAQYWISDSAGPFGFSASNAIAQSTN
jgi:hypothetical protein